MTTPTIALATPSDLLPPILQSKPTWVDMTDVFGRVMDTNVEQMIGDLERLRNISADTDSGILNATARLLGFDLSQDVLNLNADNLVKVVSQLSLYPDQNGTELFVKFVSLVLNSETKVTYLWTKDYVNFYPKPLGKTLELGGNWFKTTHIELSLAMLSLETLNLNTGVTLIKRIQDLFFSFSPAPLVIERMDIIERFDDNDTTFGFGALEVYGEATVIID